MFNIKLQQVGKKFGSQWLLKNINCKFEQGNSYALLGNNGSGKSTLLQLIYGWQTPSKGVVEYTNHQNAVIEPTQIFKHTAFVAPYIELADELTLTEQLTFYFKFKQIANTASINELINQIGLSQSANKPLKYFSSGMKQRVKLAQVFYADVPIWFLDEPCTNLDDDGINWYNEHVAKQAADKLIIVASNQQHEYAFAKVKMQVGEMP